MYNFKDNNWPFAPSKWPFFYGWMILFCSVLGFLCSIPGQTLGVAVFTDPLIAATGLTRVELSITYMLGTMLSALMLTKAGKLFDNFGARPMGALVALALGVTLLLLSQVDHVVNGLSRLFADRFRLATGFGVMIIGFFALRFLGQGMTTLVARNMAMKWFERRRGFVNGLIGVASTLGESYAPLLFSFLIAAYSWRGTWEIMGVFIGVVFAGFVYLFYRDNPEDCGLKPDNESQNPTAQAVLDTGRQYTLKEARRTFAFWIFNLPAAMSALYATGLFFHLVSIFAESGYDKTQAVLVLPPIALIGVVLSFVGSWLSDHVRIKIHLIAYNAGMVVSMLGLLYLATSWGRVLLIAGTGVMGGMSSVVNGVTWPRFFGRRHLGSISGFNMAFTVFASAIGPTIFSLSLDRIGSYDTAIGVCLVCMIPLLIGAFWGNNPQRLKARS